MIFYEYYSFVEHYAYETKVILGGNEFDLSNYKVDHAIFPDFLLKDFAKPVSEDDRGTFLWDKFGGIPDGIRHGGTFEWLLYNTARSQPNYEGGNKWEMMETLDGKSFFMYPILEEDAVLQKELHFIRGSYRKMDAKLFGMACTLDALRDLAVNEGEEVVKDLYLNLQDTFWRLCYEYLETSQEDFKTLLNKRNASYEEIAQVRKVVQILCDTVEYLV